MNEISCTCKTCKNSVWNTIDGECEECYFKSQERPRKRESMITEQDKVFLEYVQQYKSLGYERMVEIIGTAWHVELKAKQQNDTNDLAEAILSCIRNTKSNMGRDNSEKEASHLWILMDKIHELCCASMDE